MNLMLNIAVGIEREVMIMAGLLAIILVGVLGIIAGWTARWYWVDKRKKKA